MLSEGVDYLFFRTAYYSGGAITGLKNSEVAVVATRRYLFLAPIRETSLGLGKVTFTDHEIGGLEVPAMLARLLASPELTVAALEAQLASTLGEDHVVQLDELASLTVWSRFFRQVRFKQRGRRATQVLALRGKDNHARFERFYADTIAAR
jgi:hypothetical protein